MANARPLANLTETGFEGSLRDQDRSPTAIASEQPAIDKAKADGIMLDMPKIVTVMEVTTTQTVPVNPTAPTTVGNNQTVKV